jgi:hypothetical protein
MNVSKTIMQNFNRAATAVLFCLLTLTPALALTNGNHQLSLNNSSDNAQKPSAKFDRVWVDYDVTEGSQNGMRIHVQFTAYGMKNLDSYLAIYFETAAGERLKDKNRSFNSTTGEVAVYRSLKPGYDEAVYNDYTVFMPYDELDLGDGNWDLRMDIDLIYKAGGLIQHLTHKEFNYKQGDETPSISATVKKVWVDYDITQAGRKGMRIHVNFEVKGLKGIDSKLVLRVQNSNSEFLSSTSPAFANADGQLEIAFDMKPGYATTVYEDATVFLPYNVINIRKGSWDLKLDLDLNYENGDLIEHLYLHEFEFTK